MSTSATKKIVNMWKSLGAEISLPTRTLNTWVSAEDVKAFGELAEDAITELIFDEFNSEIFKTLHELPARMSFRVDDDLDECYDELVDKLKRATSPNETDATPGHNVLLLDPAIEYLLNNAGIEASPFSTIVVGTRKYVAWIVSEISDVFVLQPGWLTYIYNEGVTSVHTANPAGHGYMTDIQYEIDSGKIVRIRRRA